MTPIDTDEDRRFNNVKPTAWQNRVPSGRYDLVVIGGGTAGLVSAAGGAGLGARVALIECDALGGDCLNTGCVPSKALLQSARVAAAFSQAWHYGVQSDSDPQVDFPTVMQRMRKLRAEISENDSTERFSRLGVHVFFGRAAFTGPKSVSVDGTQIAFKRAILATGGSPHVPPMKGIETVNVLTSESVFDLETLPRRLGVIGGGPIGCEIAQAFARFGSEVTLIHSKKSVLPREDPNAAAIVMEALERDGVKVICEATNVSVQRQPSGVRISADQPKNNLFFDVDRVLLATGRRPNIDGLNLEAAQVHYDSDRGIDVDDRLRTSNPRVYAAGDVCSKFQFTHAADALARIALGNALLGLRGRASKLHIPWSTYTSPEIAQIGIQPWSAAKDGTEFDSFTQYFKDVDRCILDGETEGFVKLYVRRHSDKIIGATVVGQHAGELIGFVSLAMTNRIGLKKMAGTIFPYPTKSEVFRRLGDQYNRTRLTPGVKGLISRWISWRG
tara:strand:- start:1791 stop:3293 length:1503 start_codon:yes stop_codon:yes gene_type:complete